MKSINLSHFSKGTQLAIKRELMFGNTETAAEVVRTREEILKEMSDIRSKLFDIKQAAKDSRKITSQIKFSQEASDILIAVEGLVKKLKIESDEFNDAKDKVIEAKDSLESAIFGLDDVFSDTISNLENQLIDLDYELDDLKAAEQEDESD